MHEILALYLEKENFTVSSVYDGEEALNKIEKRSWFENHSSGEKSDS